MPSDQPQPTAQSPVGVHRLEDLLAQLEGHGLKRNGHDTLLKKAVDAETYYPDNDLAVDVLRSKYLAPGETGPLQMWDRIARVMASVEKDKEYWYDRFFSLLLDFKFIPGGRVMHGAGREEARRKPTLSNCYVIPIEEDSLDGIYRCLTESAMVYRTGGGVGTDLSILRPKGAPVNATVDKSPGCTAFMNLLSESTNAVSQAGRRGALMLTLRVDHPDIEDFITIKNDANRVKVQYANISVLVTHEFMEAVLADRDFDLRWGGQVYRTVRARELWNRIITNAHSSAEPGIIFWDTMREYHNVEYANPLTSTNPCVTGDTLVYTHGGLYPIAELCERGAAPDLVLDSRFQAGRFGPGLAPFPTGVKPVFRLKTREGYEVRVTADHRFMTDRGWMAACDLQPGNRLHILDTKGAFGSEGTAAEGRVLGWLIGDGHITGASGHGAVLGFWGADRAELADPFAADVNEILGQDPETAHYPVGVVQVAKRDLATVSSVRLREVVAERFGVRAENKLAGLPEAAFRASEEFQRGLLQALFTADGHVAGHPGKGVSVRLTSISLELLRDAQRLLLNFGIASRIYPERYPARRVEFKGRPYECQAVHDLVISRSNLFAFAEELGFLSAAKQSALIGRLAEYEGRGPYRETFEARFESLTPEGEELVYDLTEPLTHSFVANGFVVHNCGEQPLASYTACNLGNLNLTLFVRPDGKFDYSALAESTRVAIRFLDDVIEYNMERHALPKIREAVSSDRRVGLGVTGLADALMLMKIKYDSPEALEAVEQIMQTICYNSYETSIDLAREKGAFTLFDWEGVAKSKFIQSLPQGLQDKIRRFGLRNSTLITMPPVGTGSIVAQTTSGIEPIFCTSYKRRVKQADGETFREYKVYHPLVKTLFGDDEHLPPYVVTSHQIDPYFRVKIQGVIQKYTDSSISSTINLPEDISVETVADIYITAYKEGLKGVTVYREGSREGILQTDNKEAEKETAQPPATGERVRHPRRRPSVTRGLTERIRTGEGNIYVTINEDDEGLCEVFSTIGKAGGNAAAQSEAICRLISLALRSSIDPQEVIKALKGISGPAPVWENGEQILSTPDAIGKALERHLKRRLEGEMAAAAGVPPATPEATSAKILVTCPECGSTVSHEGSCLSCKHCGWSKC